MAKADTQRKLSASSLGFEANLIATKDQLRGNRDTAEHKHAALGLIFETLQAANKQQSFCSR